MFLLYFDERKPVGQREQEEEEDEATIYHSKEQQRVSNKHRRSFSGSANNA